MMPGATPTWTAWAVAKLIYGIQRQAYRARKTNP